MFVSLLGQTSIFIRRYRLSERRKLLKHIVFGDSAALFTDREDDALLLLLLQQIDDALRDPMPLRGSQNMRILLRYSQLVGTYFRCDTISPLSETTLRTITAKFQHRFADARTSLEREIHKNHVRVSKKAAFDFVLRNGNAAAETSRQSRRRHR